MRTLAIGRGAMGIAVASLLTSCGGSQLPIAAPVGLTPAAASARAMKDGKLSVKGDLLYVTTKDHVYFLSYPKGDELGTLRTGRNPGSFICPDQKNGYVYLLNGISLQKYPRGATDPTVTTQTPRGENLGCAVNPVTGDVAIAHDDVSSTQSGIYVYRNGSGRPKIYRDSNMMSYAYCAYDDGGNLFVNGVNTSYQYALAELPNGVKTFTQIALDRSLGIGLLQWAGKYLTVEIAREPTIYRIAFAGSSGSVVGETKLYVHGGKLKSYSLTWIQGSTVVGGHWLAGQGKPYKDYDIGFWNYPAGGNAYKLISGLTNGGKDQIRYLAVSPALK
ncbi:MAG: hypothetical protein WA814_00610 [Candidatus Baltobacteraceae bacterium]